MAATAHTNSQQQNHRLRADKRQGHEWVVLELILLAKSLPQILLLLIHKQYLTRIEAS